MHWTLRQAGLLNRWGRGRLARVLAAALVGALTGLALFSVTQVTGRSLFVITGGVAGMAVAFAIEAYGRAARLTEVRVTVPQISEFTFVVNNDARQVAWQLFVETVTRVSTQPLAGDEGHLREALNSLYGLFATTRETLRASRPSIAVSGGQTVEYLAVTMLNRELRPFLSAWHPRLSAYERDHPAAPESNWPGNAACREALRVVQNDLHSYALGFARLAGVRGAEALLGGNGPSS
ncbi:hypothetical protein [Streptomyces poonensis]|uniref:Uncharacterized protein n=1 Tax=Streptomyces poonensis TaxID=68255 RepID=A0A918PBV0_9ACTN|nr:hypothetical protein [Streptomyces poonensis]GGY97688.1 hypothetical protein GCM10010365_15220 [Streptomyces poonensis]